MTMLDPVIRACALSDRGQPRAAFRVLLRAARRGDAGAFVNLGFVYDTGTGVRPSKAKAMYWYRRAVKRGHSAGAHNIATIFRDRGATSRAKLWLRRAIALGDSGSNILLGQILLAERDPQSALACFGAVGSDACAADEEAALAWKATAQSALGAVGEERGHA